MDKSLLYEILRHGVKAPSSQNIQPWKIRLLKNYEGFILSVTPDRRNFFDVKDMNTILAGGLFLENIRVAALKFGFEPIIDLNENEESLEIAKVTFKKGKKISAKDDLLYEQIFERSNYRDAFQAGDLPNEFYREINKIFSEDDDVRIKLHKHDSNERIRELIYECDKIRYGNKKCHDTLYRGVRVTDEEIALGNGLNYKTFEIPVAPKIGLNLMMNYNLVKKLSLNKLIAKISCKDLCDKSAGVGFVYTQNKMTKKKVILVGMKTQRFWLYITQFNNGNGHIQPYDSVPAFFKRLKVLNGKGFNHEEYKKLTEIKEEFFELSNLKESDDMVLLFRYGIANKKPKFEEIRKPVEEFIEN